MRLSPFVEEINHALHAALKFQRGEAPTRDEDYARNLELQAQVDTYLVLLIFVAFFRRPGRSRARIAAGCAFTCLNRDTDAHFETGRSPRATRRRLSLRNRTRAILKAWQPLVASRRYGCFMPLSTMRSAHTSFHSASEPESSSLSGLRSRAHRREGHLI